MTIEKRKLSKLILLNCLTLGIYGAVMYQNLGNEINELCEGDGEEPKFGYIGAVLIGIVCPIYRLYWWYRQASRIKLNAGRYDLVVRESGVDALMFRTVGQIPVLLATAASLLVHLVLPALVVWLLSLISMGVAIAFAIVFIVILALFLPDFTAGAYVSTYFVFKNMNRLADVGMRGRPFEPMDYEYYPSVQNAYTNFVPQLINAGGPPIPDEPPRNKAFLEAVKGSNKGYSFELIPGEEIIIGRNPAEANIVIDSQYDKISGRHVGVLFETESDIFRVVDYSLNGTYVDGRKLENGREYIFRRGSYIELVDGKNAFRLK